MSERMFESIWSLFADKYTEGFQGLPMGKMKEGVKDCIEQFMSGYIIPKDEPEDIPYLVFAAATKKLIDSWSTFPHMRALWCAARREMDKCGVYEKTPERKLLEGGA